MDTAKYRIEIFSKIEDHRGKSWCKRLASFGYHVADVTLTDNYLINAPLDEKDVSRLAQALAQRVSQEYRINDPFSPDNFVYAVEIGYLPGVTDNVSHTVREIMDDLFKKEFNKEKSVFSTTTYFFWGNLSLDEIETIALELYNPLIQRVKILPAQSYAQNGGMGNRIPIVHMNESIKADVVDLAVDDGELARLAKEGIRNADGSRRGPLALDKESMDVIIAYFKDKEKRNPYDVELESIAQTWSEHCKHTIFAAKIDGEPDGVFKKYIKAATDTIIKKRGDEFCVSIFEDNAGGISFDDNWVVSDKVETHNSPSALDPFGGSITGIVGVNRDEMGFGMGAKPIANRYGFCFADPEDKSPFYRSKDKSSKMLSPRRIMEGVIAGVNSGGNCSGIPTPQGFVYFDKSYKGKPLVFVGTIGLLPKMIHGNSAVVKKARPGDLVVIAGGRVGLDGIHGATFSSEALTSGSPAAAVQIGDPITQKKMSDVIVKEARELGLYNSITDNGAGGMSCSVAEMAKESGGFEVDLEKVPLKYPGLAPWQIWVSESQERMTFAVKPDKWNELNTLFKSRGVEATVIGKFTGTGRGFVRYKGETVFDLDMNFLHNGLPRKSLTSKLNLKTLKDTPPKEETNYTKELHDMISRLNLCSYEFITAQFDHEVQGNSIIKPVQGKGRVNAPFSVIRPVYDSWKGVALSQGLYPSYADIDPYRMAAASIDTAVRNAIVAGANPDQIAILDNFCWCDSLNPERLGQLKAAAQACHDYAIEYNAPFVSGKDSMFNDFKGYDENFKEIKVSALPTLLISSIAIVDDVRLTQSCDFKNDGDSLYLMGITKAELAGSEYFAYKGELAGRDAILAGEVPSVEAAYNLDLYRRYALALKAGIVASAIGLERGGFAAALVKCAIAGELGAQVELGKMAADAALRDYELLFSESQGRILLSVRRGFEKQFETIADGTAHKIGTVSGGAIKITGAKGAQVADADIKTLGDSYRRRFKNY